MKKALSLILCAVLIAGFCVPAAAAAPGDLTWDGKAATLADIAQKTGYDMVNSDGSYKPLYYYYASLLWENGLFLGSAGSFDLDNRLTRAEGVVMTIRLLGVESAAKATTADITFTDVPEWAKPYVAYAVQNGIANGYSAETFGAADPMTAAQFITLALRAMGYKDGEDFTWDKSWDKALEIGLIGQGCHTQYSRSNLFLRDNAAIIAYNAVFSAPTKAGEKLADTMSMPGRPAGDVPTAVREADGGGSDDKRPTGGNVSISRMPGIYINYTNLAGKLVSAEATYLVTADYDGIVDFTGTVNGKSVSGQLIVEADVTYILAFTFAIRGEPGYTVSNTISIKAGNATFTDTITINGTITNIYIA